MEGDDERARRKGERGRETKREEIVVSGDIRHIENTL